MSDEIERVRPDFPNVFDSTMISTFRSCPRKFQIQYLLHRRAEENVHLIAGGAFAKGIETAREAFFVHGDNPEQAVAKGIHALFQAYGPFEPPEGTAKTPERMAGALEFYFANYPLTDTRFAPHLIGDKHAIEFSFANPLGIHHPVSKDPILFCGRADMIANYSTAGLFLFDEKTATSLGPQWAKQWNLRSQFTAYTWAAHEWDLPVKGAIIRGISILKTKYDTTEVIVYRPEWQVQRWYAQVLRDITRAITMWAKGEFDYNLDHTCGDFGGCSYQTACLSANPDQWLETQFPYNPWNPLRHIEDVSSHATLTTH